MDLSAKKRYSVWKSSLVMGKEAHRADKSIPGREDEMKSKKIISNRSWQSSMSRLFSCFWYICFRASAQVTHTLRISYGIWIPMNHSCHFCGEMRN